MPEEIKIPGSQCKPRQRTNKDSDLDARTCFEQGMLRKQPNLDIVAEDDPGK